ncbi:MAG: glycosyltransferase [Anaerolineales bacterium]|nr:glycosyltransferase [Anaerolineales bacterium]
MGFIDRHRTSASTSRSSRCGRLSRSGVAPPPNLYFLGLKAQTDLPSYLAHSEVAIIPWKVNSITQATSPLKLYEYLAMRRPVVVPDLKPLQGIPGLLRSRTSEEFIKLVGEAREKKLPLEDIDAFIAENNWQAVLDNW